MYLIHNTTTDALKSILKDGYLKSFSLLEEPPKSNEGEGIYNENKFVYFSCTDRLFDNRIISKITMYFDAKLLFNNSFYVANMHSASPENLAEWYYTNDEGKKVKQYKRKYNKYYTKYNSVLKKLYNHSISLLNGRAFQIFQQVAIKNKINLNELVGIEFKHKSKTDNIIINYITKYYPNIIIKKTYK